MEHIYDDNVIQDANYLYNQEKRRKWEEENNAPFPEDGPVYSMQSDQIRCLCASLVYHINASNGIHTPLSL